MLANALSRFRSFLFSIPLIIAVTALMGIVVAAGALLGLRENFQDWCMRLWARMILRASLVRVTITGLGNIDPGKTYVFCSNHLSYMDPPVLVASLGHRVRFLAKKSLFAIPFLGWAMRVGGHVPIDRENPHAASRGLKRAGENVRRGKSIVLFPEGGRSLDGAIQPFLSGGFRLAIEVEAPVVPVAILGTREVLAPGSIHLRGGHVRVRVGAPIPTAGMADENRKQLAAKTEQAVREMLES